MNPDQFILNTDYPIEQIIGSSSGSFTRNSSNFLTPHAFNHGFTFAPLYIMQWSTNSNFTPAYSEQLMGDGSVPLLEAQTDASTTYLYSFVPSGSVTFYYRVVYFMPPDINVDVPETASAYNTYVFNTERQYPKVILQGKTTGGTISHNLGFYPMVDFWLHRVSDGMIRHFPVTETDSGNEGGAIITTSSVQFLPPGGHDYAYYKIYGDKT